MQSRTYLLYRTPPRIWRMANRVPRNTWTLAYEEEWTAADVEAETFASYLYLWPGNKPGEVPLYHRHPSLLVGYQPTLRRLVIDAGRGGKAPRARGSW